MAMDPGGADLRRLEADSLAFLLRRSCVFFASMVGGSKGEQYYVSVRIQVAFFMCVRTDVVLCVLSIRGIGLHISALPSSAGHFPCWLAATAIISNS